MSVSNLPLLLGTQVPLGVTAFRSGPTPVAMGCSFYRTVVLFSQQQTAAATYSGLPPWEDRSPVKGRSLL